MREIYENPILHKLVQDIEANPHKFLNYSSMDGLIMYRGKIYLKEDSQFIERIIEEYHKSIIGHSGITRTIKRMPFFGGKVWLIQLHLLCKNVLFAGRTNPST